MSLENERRRLADMEGRETYKQPLAKYVELEAIQAQRKLVTALEQLEQAREALEYCRDESTDIWIGRKAEAALQALKQQEVG